IFPRRTAGDCARATSTASHCRTEPICSSGKASRHFSCRSENAPPDLRTGDVILTPLVEVVADVLVAGLVTVGLDEPAADSPRHREPLRVAMFLDNGTLAGGDERIDRFQHGHRPARP